MSNFVAGKVLVKTESVTDIAEGAVNKISEILGDDWCDKARYDVFVVILNALTRAVNSEKGL